MDYIYTVRNAHKDRLEDAGVVTYHPEDGYGVLNNPRTILRKQLQRLRTLAVTVLQVAR
jgi:hypothetical protein